MLQQLLDDHQRLRDITTLLRAQLRMAMVPTGKSFAEHRAALAGQLLHHIALKEQYLRRLNAARDNLRARGEPMGPRFSAHLARWTGDRIVRHWNQFRLELGTFLDDLEEEMRFEEGELFPAAVTRDIAPRATEPSIAEPSLLEGARYYS